MKTRNYENIAETFVGIWRSLLSGLACNLTTQSLLISVSDG